MSGRDRARTPARSRRRCSTPTRTTSRRASGSRGACKPGTILRGGYGISYNSGIVRRRSRGSWSAQPPFAVTEQQHRHRSRSADASRTRSRPPRRATRPTTTASTRTTRSASCRRGTPTSREICGRSGTSAPATRRRAARSLDIVRAPNRGPTGLRIPGVAAVPVADVRGLVGPARRHVPRVAPSGERHRRRRHLHARQVARQRVVHRRRRHDRRAGRSEPRRRMGAVEFRPAPPALGERQHRAAVRAEPPVARAARRAGSRCSRDWRVTTNFTLAVGDAAHAARHRGGERRRARHERHAARQLQRRAGAARGPDDRSVLQHHARSRFRRPERSATPSRNMIIGPGSRLLNAQFSRDVRMGGNRAS